uniref:H/ACA ribonucleoprotein complex subunit 2 n=1 Tax=Prasinoderma coloniale TaxID=156133 RepID=A0A7R9TAN6_9VIRI
MAKDKKEKKEKKELKAEKKISKSAKKEKKSSASEAAPAAPRRVGTPGVFAKPLAGEALSAQLLALVGAAAKAKQLKRGVKEVVKHVRKAPSGLCVIAADISPVDVIIHVPVLCEEAGMSYVYVSSKEALGAAGATKRPTSCVVVVDGAKGGAKGDSGVAALYKDAAKAVKALH